MTITAELVRSNAGAYHTTLSNGRHIWFADVAASAGGQDTAAQPHDLLDSALAACTTLTLALYLDRKGWPVSSLHVEVDRGETRGLDGKVDYQLTRRVAVVGELSPEQREQLLAIANRCPIHRVLEGHIAVQTALA